MVLLRFLLYGVCEIGRKSREWIRQRSPSQKKKKDKTYWVPINKKHVRFTLYYSVEGLGIKKRNHKAERIEEEGVVRGLLFPFFFFFF